MYVKNRKNSEFFALTTLQVVAGIVVPPKKEVASGYESPMPLAYSQFPAQQLAEQLTLHQDLLWKSVNLFDVFSDTSLNFEKIPAIVFARALKFWVTHNELCSLLTI